MNKNNVIGNMIWRFAERCGNQGINFVVSIILARILSPEEYGTIALVTVFITILQVFIYGGFGDSLIQKKDADELDFSTVFYFQMFACTMLYVLLYFTAPFIADFYGDASLTQILRILGLKLIIIGLLSVQNAYVSRNMQFKKFFYSTLTGTVVSAVIGIWMAYAGFGVWALVGQTLTATVLSTVVLWFTVEFRPRLIFSFERLKVLFSFGWKILTYNLVETLYKNLRNLIIGKVYSTTDLGYYSKGEQFPKLIITNINTTIDNVLLPTMSSVQDNKERVKTIARKSIRTSSYIIWPAMVGLFVCAEPLVELVLTAKWLSVVPYLRIFCVTYAFWPIQTANLSALKAIGRSDMYLKLQVIKKIIGVVSILLTINMGVFAIALAGVFVTPIEVFINASPNKKLINYSYIEQMKDIIPSILLACAMGACVWWFQYMDLPCVIILLIQAILGVAIYILLSIIFKMESFFYLWKTMRGMFVKAGK